MSVLGRRTERSIYFGFMLLWLMAALGYAGVSAASQSANYQLIETSVGGTGLLNSTSTNYQARQAGGILGLGTSKSAASQVEAGHVTTGSPALSFSILSGSPSFGSFSPTSTATATSQFEVTDYTSYGYIVQMYGTPPTGSSGY